MALPLGLIVDDEPDLRELLKITLGKMNIDVIAADSLSNAKKALQEHRFDFCLTDMRLTDGDGLSLVDHIQQYYSHIPIAVITAYGSMELAIAALKSGAFDFVSKPIDLKILRDLVSTALKISKPIVETDGSLAHYGLLGNNSGIKELGNKIRKLSRSQAPVYISGESGTGKELVARLIHQLGPRSEAPFVPVNCGAIPENLMESELFGHRKGSFTGALVNKDGLFQVANGGTLFLDEVADLPLNMQVKLLRAIQEKAVRPIGGQHEVSVDVRILTATHKNLHKLVQKSLFRQDLFYRINVIELQVPALRDRKDDIPLLAEHILLQLAERSNVGAKPQLAKDSLTLLQNYSFPGNIRELENILERALTLCENNIITPDDLHLKDIPHEPTEHHQAAETKHDENVPLEFYMDEIEKRRIQQALIKSHGNKTGAAKILGLTLRALRYRMKKLGLD